MRKAGLALVAALLFNASASAGELAVASLSEPPMTRRAPAGLQLALICFKSGEQLSGMNKLCFYNCNGSGTAVTIGATQLCPLTMSQ